MNKEFVNLNENTSIVKDDDGKTKKRDTKVNDKVLLLENKIKKTKEEIEKTKIDLAESKKHLDDLKMLSIFLLLCIFPIGSSIGIIFSLANLSLLASISFSVITSILVTALGVEIFESVKKKTKNQIFLLEAKLEESENLKEEYENELKIAKDLLSKEDTKIDLETVSLKEKNEIELPKVEEKIEERTEETLEKMEEQKKLVLKR